MKRYTCVLVYGWYTKVIKKIRNQKLRYMKRYTKILVYERYTSQKKPYKVVYQPFFCRVHMIKHSKTNLSYNPPVCLKLLESLSMRLLFISIMVIPKILISATPYHIYQPFSILVSIVIVGRM